MERLQETTSVQFSCSFTGYQYAGASSTSCAALCTLYTPEDAQLIAYLKNTVQLAAARQSRSDLRSSTTSAYLLPRLNTKFGERAFSQAGPSAWNALPTHIRDVPSPNSFRKLLTRGQSNLTKSASRGAHSPVRGHPRGSKFVPLNSWGRVSY